MNTKETANGQVGWGFIAWELFWTPIEMASVGLGLVLGLYFHNWPLATPILLALVPLSCVVRYLHYSKLQ